MDWEKIIRLLSKIILQIIYLAVIVKVVNNEDDDDTSDENKTNDDDQTEEDVFGVTTVVNLRKHQVGNLKYTSTELGVTGSLLPVSTKVVP